MMYGIDDSFDGVLYLGYHAPAGDPNFTSGSAITHIDQETTCIHLNGKVMSGVHAEQLYSSIITYRCCFFPEIQKRSAVRPKN